MRKFVRGRRRYISAGRQKSVRQQPGDISLCDSSRATEAGAAEAGNQETKIGTYQQGDSSPQVPAAPAATAAPATSAVTSWLTGHRSYLPTVRKLGFVVGVDSMEGKRQVYLTSPPATTRFAQRHSRSSSNSVCTLLLHLVSPSPSLHDFVWPTRVGYPRCAYALYPRRSTKQHRCSARRTSSITVAHEVRSAFVVPFAHHGTVWIHQSAFKACLAWTPAHRNTKLVSTMQNGQRPNLGFVALLFPTVFHHNIDPGEQEVCACEPVKGTPMKTASTGDSVQANAEKSPVIWGNMIRYVGVVLVAAAVIHQARGGYAKEIALELNALFDSVWCPLHTWVQIVLVFASWTLCFRVAKNFVDSFGE